MSSDTYGIAAATTELEKAALRFMIAQIRAGAVDDEKIARWAQDVVARACRGAAAPAQPRELDPSWPSLGLPHDDPRCRPPGQR